MVKKRYDIIFLMVLFLFGFFAVFSYGANLDQDLEQGILFSNIKEYLSQLPFETSLQQELTDAGVVEISSTAEKDHGVAAYYPISFIWYVNRASSYFGSVLWHTYTYIFIFIVGYCSLYLLIKELFGCRKIASFVVLLSFLTPRMFAESHYNNKDMILYALLYAIFYWGWRLIKNCSIRNVIIFAVCGAFAFNTKVIGAWFFGIIGLYALINFIVSGRFNKNILWKCLLCIGIWIGTYIVITPACWGNIIEFFKYLIFYAVDFKRWHSYILFKGKLIHKEYTGIPQKYLPTMMVYTIPVGILLMIVWGYIVLTFDFVKSRFRRIFEMEGYVTVILFTGIVPLVYAVIAATPVYNGWRHFYFVYATMIIGAGYGIYRLSDKSKSEFYQKILQSCGILYILILAIMVGINHPQEHSYYNWLAGDNLEDYYELDYWDMSTWQAFQIIEKESKNQNVVSVGALNMPTLWGLEVNWEVLPQKQKQTIQIENEWEQADYLIVNTTYANIYSVELYEEVKTQYELIDSITSYGNTVCEIYKKCTY